jgi:preprotein translocase subunit YajC
MNRIRVLLLAGAPFALFAESNGTPESSPAPAPVAGGAPAPSATSTAHAAEAQPTGGQQKPAGQDPFGGMGFLLIMAIPLALMWFMATRSQKREEKKKQDLLAAIKRGDQIVTIGGAHGEVQSVGETTVDVRLGKGDDASVVTFNKSAVATIAGAEAAKGK